LGEAAQVGDVDYWGRQMVPAGGGLAGDGGDVGGEEEALGDEGLGGALDLGEVVGAGGVALGDGGARVVGGERDARVVANGSHVPISITSSWGAPAAGARKFQPV